MTRKVPCVMPHTGVSMSTFSARKKEVNIWDHHMRVSLRVL
jgi:hypothetical protein